MPGPSDSKKSPHMARLLAGQWVSAVEGKAYEARFTGNVDAHWKMTDVWNMGILAEDGRELSLVGQLKQTVTKQKQAFDEAKQALERAQQEQKRVAALVEQKEHELENTRRRLAAEKITKQQRFDQLKRDYKAQEEKITALSVVVNYGAQKEGEFKEKFKKLATDYLKTAALLTRQQEIEAVIARVPQLAAAFSSEISGKLLSQSLLSQSCIKLISALATPEFKAAAESKYAEQKAAYDARKAEFIERAKAEARRDVEPVKRKYVIKYYTDGLLRYLESRLTGATDEEKRIIINAAITHLNADFGVGNADPILRQTYPIRGADRRFTDFNSVIDFAVEQNMLQGTSSWGGIKPQQKIMGLFTALRDRNPAAAARQYITQQSGGGEFATNYVAPLTDEAINNARAVHSELATREQAAANTAAALFDQQNQRRQPVLADHNEMVAALREHLTVVATSNDPDVIASSLRQITDKIGTFPDTQRENMSALLGYIMRPPAPLQVQQQTANQFLQDLDRHYYDQSDLQGRATRLLDIVNRTAASCTSDLLQDFRTQLTTASAACEAELEQQRRELEVLETEQHELSDRLEEAEKAVLGHDAYAEGELDQATTNLQRARADLQRADTAVQQATDLVAQKKTVLEQAQAAFRQVPQQREQDLLKVIKAQVLIATKRYFDAVRDKWGRSYGKEQAMALLAKVLAASTFTGAVEAIQDKLTASGKWGGVTLNDDSFNTFLLKEFYNNANGFFHLQTGADGNLILPQYDRTLVSFACNDNSVDDLDRRLKTLAVPAEPGGDQVGALTGAPRKRDDRILVRDQVVRQLNELADRITKDVRPQEAANEDERDGDAARGPSAAAAA